LTLTDLLNHWSLAENPFRGEEARADDVFARMSGGGAAGDADGLATGVHHSDFEKILGDPLRPGPAVVFGEKGSGKTAIRLQLVRRIDEHNTKHPGARILVVIYDDLNGVLGRLHDRIGAKSAKDSLQKIRLVDHIDAILSLAVPRLVDSVLQEGPARNAIDLGANPLRTIRGIDRAQRESVLLLQALYDRPDIAPLRTARLRSKLRLGFDGRKMLVRMLLVLMPLLVLAGLVWRRWYAPPTMSSWALTVLDWSLVGLTAIFAVVALKVGVWDKLALLRTAHRVKRQLRVVSRGDVSFAKSIRGLPAGVREIAALPVTDSDEPRFAMLTRLLRILRPLGYAGVFVIVDRIDEPTLVGGDPERMKAVVWPMLSNKFLQMEGVGVKLLLPVELRHAVFRESSAFFQEARLDKQGLIERLSWTGASLYDLCEARLRACLKTGSPDRQLIDLFAEDVARPELIDALDRMKQPRDAFKLLYRCLIDHCANVTQGENQWRIPRHILMQVLKSENERLQQFQQGIRPG